MILSTVGETGFETDEDGATWVFDDERGRWLPCVTVSASALEFRLDIPPLREPPRLYSGGSGLVDWLPTIKEAR